MSNTIPERDGSRRGRGPAQGRRQARRWPGLPACWLILSLAVAGPLSGELVLLNGGGFYKVEEFEIEDQRIRLHLKGGGQVVLSMLRVDRILEDEVKPGPPEPPPEPPPSFDLRFASQGVPEGPYSDLILEVAERHGLNPRLVSAVARAESAYRAGAISHKGAQGLMQLMPATAERFGLRGQQVFDPAKNLNAGARYLRWLADRFDDRLAWVLAGYNAGEGTVDRYGGVPPYRETRGYIRKIYATLGLGEDLLAGELGPG